MAARSVATRGPSILLARQSPAFVAAAHVAGSVGRCRVVILAIIFIVMGHEFGHFITAKRAGHEGHGLLRRLRAGPLVDDRSARPATACAPSSLGGYVKVPGMTWAEEIDPERGDAHLPLGVLSAQGALRVGRLAHAHRDGARARVGVAHVHRAALSESRRRRRVHAMARSREERGADRRTARSATASSPIDGTRSRATTNSITTGRATVPASR